MVGSCCCAKSDEEMMFVSDRFQPLRKKRWLSAFLDVLVLDVGNWIVLARVWLVRCRIPW